MHDAGNDDSDEGENVWGDWDDDDDDDDVGGGDANVWGGLDGDAQSATIGGAGPPPASLSSTAARTAPALGLRAEPAVGSVSRSLSLFDAIGGGDDDDDTPGGGEDEGEDDGWAWGDGDDDDDDDDEDVWADLE